MVTGSPGGPRIITTTLETLLDVLVYGMSAQAAVDAPRTHMQWLPDELEYEPGAFTTETGRAAAGNGIHVERSCEVGLGAGDRRKCPDRIARGRQRPAHAGGVRRRVLRPVIEKNG